MASALCEIQNTGLKDLGSSDEYILPTNIINQMKASHPGYQIRKVLFFDSIEFRKF